MCLDRLSAPERHRRDPRLGAVAFPVDEFGLGYFDGTHLYEHADPRQGVQPDWNSYIFNYGRTRCGAFLSASACSGSKSFTSTACGWMPWPRCSTWTTSRKPGQWVPNRFGGRENLEAIDFLRRSTSEVYRSFPGRHDDRRGIDGLAHGLAADLRGRAGLRLQVGHGLDARHAATTCGRTRSTAGTITTS